MDHGTPVFGIILAGGHGSRMFAHRHAHSARDNRDKPLVELDGRPLLAHIIDRVKGQVARLALNANGGPERFSRFGLTVVPDEITGGQGPLAGLHAGLAFAEREAGPDVWIATVPGDTPFLPENLVARLSAAATGSRPAIATSSGQRHPTIGLWPASLKSEVADAIAGGELSADRFAAAQAAVEVAFPFGDSGSQRLDPFFNINTPADLERAAAILQQTR
jgi:molybdopterin-guanine dinucleotide biosynthesis protein A